VKGGREARRRGHGGGWDQTTATGSTPRAEVLLVTPARSAYKLAMSSSRRLLTLALGLLSIGFIGCSAPVEGPSGLASVRKVFVTETQSAGVTEADALGDAVHDAAVRELARLGYQAVATSTEAQASLRSSWRVQKAVDGRISLALSISIFDPSGRRLLSTDSGTVLSVNFWNESTVRRAIEQALARLPRPTTAPSAQK
jgi:hypothetical protein